MKIRIQTTQNVGIEYEVAGIAYRFIAALIDGAVFAGYYALFLIILWIDPYLFAETWVRIVILTLPILYPLVCEIFMDGQTIGKRAMKLKVVRLDGGEPSIGSYILRWFLWIFEANPMVAMSGLGAVGIVSVIVSRNGQRVGDHLAGTTVVRLDTATENGLAVMSMVGPDFIPRWPQVARLRDEDMAVIRKGLEASSKGAEPDIISKIAYRVAEVLGIELSGIGETEAFLKRVLLEHQFATGRA